jgi:YVTN family beta-propeller protein
MKKKNVCILVLLAALFAACSDSDIVIDPTDLPPSETQKILVLCEGIWTHDNSTLAFYDLKSQATDLDYFTTVNKRGLGDTANDMIKYGSKIYIVVNESGTIEVIDAATGKSLQQIEMKIETAEGKKISKQPRYAAAYGGKVYVTSYDDTVTRIDTVSLKIDGSVKVGRDPEGICIKNGKIYVANSGGLDFLDLDKTVSVIDLNSFEEIKQIEVGLNPYQVFADSQGDVYVNVRGNYGDIAPSFKKIKPSKDSYEVSTLTGVSVSEFTIVNDKAYILHNEWGKESKVKVFDCKTEEVVTENFVTDGTSILNGYKITADAYSGDVYVTTSDYTTSGNVLCFDNQGKCKFTLSSVGIGPNKVILLD